MVLWLCRLNPAELKWNTTIVEEAKRLGVGGWLLTIDLDEQGRLSLESPLQEAVGSGSIGLRFSLECHIIGHLTPQAEQQAATTLARYLGHEMALRLAGRPLLVVKNPEYLSHPQHAIARLRIALRRLLFAAGTESEPMLLQPSTSNAPNLDGTVEVVEGEKEDCRSGGYIRHLYKAHYRPLPSQITIPAVRPPLPQEQSENIVEDAKLYQEWLGLAAKWSAIWHDGLEEAPVLIESWASHQNWWKIVQEEKAPSATATEPSGSSTTEEHAWGKPDPAHLALLIHAFYLERLEEMLQRLPAGGGQGSIPPLDLYLSTPSHMLEPAARLLKRLDWPRARIFGVENRGRDIAPFLLHLLPAAADCGHETFVKLHTKVSPHLDQGSQWGSHLVKTLLDPYFLHSLNTRLSNDPGLGLLAPSGTLLPTTVALNRNGSKILTLLQKSKVEGRWFLGQHFVAGSMMAGRMEALRPLLKADIHMKDFEQESGQTDGTLAHALERWICILVQAAGWRVEELPGPTTDIPGFGYRWVEGCTIRSLQS
ncbi:MAG: rhamnan synthesis F family protein [Prochlorococcaceae cyanobacterium]|jgi:hypothetical protein